MLPDEICRRLGEPKVRSVFLELTAEAMKKVLKGGEIPSKSQAISPRKRNEEWGAKVWRAIDERRPKSDAAAAILMYEWLTRHRRPMLAAFLDALGVAHQDGLTDADIMTHAPPEKTRECGKALFDRFDHAEVAAYLLFLDAQSKSETFAELELPAKLGPAPAAAAQSAG